MGNNKTPEIRFAGFSDGWEQVTFSEIMTLRSETADSSNYNIDVELENLVTDLGILVGDVTMRSQSNSIFKKGDVLFGRLRPYLNKWWLADRDGIKSGEIWAFFPNKTTSSKFIYAIIQSKRFLNIANISSGTKMPRADWKKISATIYAVPSNNEQIKIGNFFKQLDDIISLHQRELDNLKQMKQGFLQKMFPKEGESVPELRLPKFEDEWEVVKSRKIFISISDKNHPNLPVLSASQEKGMVYRDEIGIDIKFDKKNTKTYKHVLPGQFIIHLRSFQGGFAYSNIEGITSPAYTVLDFANKKNQYPLFWKIIFTSNSFIKRLETITYGIRDGRSISFSDFSILTFNIPSYQEQVQIGNFFKQLDTLINLHQQELDLLKQTKKAFLQKMFI